MTLPEFTFQMLYIYFLHSFSLDNGEVILIPVLALKEDTAVMTLTSMKVTISSCNDITTFVYFVKLCDQC
jgi:hypothetical protein